MQSEGKLLPVMLLLAFVGMTAATQVVAKAAVGQLRLQETASGLDMVAALARFLITPVGLLILVGTFVAGCCYLLALSRLPLSYAYPFVALSFPVVAVLGWWFFGESISWPQIVAIVLIVAGISIHALV
jgi:drug/metabolite transporter (DMT)-like permease